MWRTGTCANAYELFGHIGTAFYDHPDWEVIRYQYGVAYPQNEVGLGHVYNPTWPVEAQAHMAWEPRYATKLRLKRPEKVVYFRVYGESQFPYAIWANGQQVTDNVVRPGLYNIIDTRDHAPASEYEIRFAPGNYWKSLGSIAGFDEWGDCVTALNSLVVARHIHTGHVIGMSTEHQANGQATQISVVAAESWDSALGRPKNALDPVCFYTGMAPMNFWINLNHHRLIVVTQHGADGCQACYVGGYLPYAPPHVFKSPPLIALGTRFRNKDSSLATRTSAANSFGPCRPPEQISGAPIRAFGPNKRKLTSAFFGPTATTGNTIYDKPDAQLQGKMGAYGVMQPFRLFDDLATKRPVGELDGLYFTVKPLVGVPGDIGQLGPGDRPCTLFSNTFHTDEWQYFAVRHD